MQVSPEPSDDISPVRILHTKLFIPRTHPDVVQRTWLDQKLVNGLKSQLMVLSAPAGFGKTTLLSNWVARLAWPVAWLSLDERENDTTRFWSYFIAALQTIKEDTGKIAFKMLQSAQPPPTEALLTELLNDISIQDGDFVMVLDDYHTIDKKSIHDGVCYLLENMPPQMHLIIAGRSKPPLPLPLLRGRRNLFELHAVDLRFTKEETSIFLNEVMELNLSADHIAAIEKMTEGWAAGIQLAAKALEAIRKEFKNTITTDTDELKTFLSAFTGSHHFVFDYLAQEVIDRQPHHIQSFLRHTAHLDRLTSPLCDALSDNGDWGGISSQAILESLETANLFIIPLDPHRQWFRYHHLFASFLRAQLDKEYPKEKKSELHRKACTWLAANGYLHDAIAHALAAQDFDLSMDLIHRVYDEMFMTSQLTTLKTWLALIPKEILSRDLELSMASAWSKLATGEMDAVEPHLRDVEKLLGTKADGSKSSMALPFEKRAFLAEISSIRSTLCFNNLNMSAVLEFCRQGRAYISTGAQGEAVAKQASVLGVLAFNQAISSEFSGDTLAAEEAFSESNKFNQQNPHLLSMGIGHLAGIQILKGQLHQAEASYMEALRSSKSQGVPSPLSAVASTGLGNLLCEWNRLDQALPHLQRGIELGRKWDLWESLLSGFTGLARLHWAQGEGSIAFACLNELNARAQQSEVLWMAQPVQAYLALLSARSGDMESAAAWVKTPPASSSSPINYFLESDALVLTRIQLLQNQPAQAANLASEVARSAQTGGRLGRWTEAGLLQGLALHLQGNMDDALPFLEKALQQTIAQGYRRIFLDEGALMADFLRQAKTAGASVAHGWDDGLVQIIDELLHLFEPLPSIKPPHPSPTAENEPALVDRKPWHSRYEALSERELDVLKLIAAGLTNQEISDRLIISLNTVKTHIKNIYQRLDVSNRAQAIARAHELNLL